MVTCPDNVDILQENGARGKPVKTAIDNWTEASGIREGYLFRAINRAGRIWGNGMTPAVKSLKSCNASHEYFDDTGPKSLITYQ